MRLFAIWVADHVVVSTREHRHNYYQLIFCRSGKGAVTVGEQQYDMSPGDVCLVKPMQRHSLIQEESMHLVEMKFISDDMRLDANLRKIPDNFKLVGPFYTERIERVVSEFYQSGFYAGETVNYELFLLLVYIMRDVFCQDPMSVDAYPESISISKNALDSNFEVRFLRVLEYIESHLSENITLEKLAATVHFDESYLVVKFKEVFGVSPMKYVNHLRMERAKSYLADGAMSITQIADSLGFSSIHYFSRYFKEKTGISPAEYRRLQRKRCASM